MGRTSDPPDVRAMDCDAMAEAMVQWFFENFEDPAQRTPWDEGEYVWIWGGPYDARDELDDAFAGAPEMAVGAAIKRIEEEGLEWAPVPHPDDYE